MVVQGPQGGQPSGPSVRRSAPARRSPAGPRPEGITGPPDALIIHRSDNGYTRHYVGEGGPPKRDEHGAAYLYHGRSYAPFRVGRYHWPKGETYHRYHRHERLPRIFLIPEYFIDNYDDYEVAAPPANAQWVRYGDDLVLVDVDTGDILNVVSGCSRTPGTDPTMGPATRGWRLRTADQKIFFRLRTEWLPFRQIAVSNRRRKSIPGLDGNVDLRAPLTLDRRSALPSGKAGLMR